MHRELDLWATWCRTPVQDGCSDPTAPVTVSSRETRTHLRQRQTRREAGTQSQRSRPGEMAQLPGQRRPWKGQLMFRSLAAALVAAGALTALGASPADAAL